jgi:hypothetical protein
MNTIAKTRRFAGTAFVAAVALLACPCDASLVRMGLNKDKMPVDIDEVLHTFERARRLQFLEMRELQTRDVIPNEESIIEAAAVEGVTIQVEDAAIDVNETASVDDDSPFLTVDDEVEEEDMVAVDSEKQEEVTVSEVGVVEEKTDGVTAVETGPRGGKADLSPKIQPTEISFMIVSCL